MGMNAQRLTVETMLRDNFAIVEPDVDFTFENLIPTKPPRNKTFVQFGISWGFSDRIAIDCDQYRYINNLYANIYAPHSQGTKDMERICDSFMSVIGSANINGMFFREFNIASVRVIDTRYLLTVGVVFQIDQSL